MSKNKWFEAFYLLFIGKSELIGNHRGWKSTILMLALASPISLGFVGAKNYELTAGAIPPNVPMIRGVGSFVQTTRGQASYVSFIANDGRIYNMERGTTVKGNIYLPQGDPAPEVYVEGFLRQDGRGYFWPTMIKLPDGRTLLTPEHALAVLNLSIRATRKLIFLSGVVIVVLWILALCLIASVKRKLI